MPCEVVYKIGGKKRGNFRVPVAFSIKYWGDESEYRPKLVLKKDYYFPDSIYIPDSTLINCTLKRNGNYCCKTKSTNLKFEYFIEKEEKFNLTKYICTKSTCESCNNHLIYLPWRPGKNPDYSDFIEVFDQIAQDLVKAYEDGVQEAMNSIYENEVEKRFGSKNIKEEIEKEMNPVRKIIV